MQNHTIALILLLLMPGAPALAASAQHVVVISIDGGKPSVIQSAQKSSKMPTVALLTAQGAITWTARTIFPSTTLPSHTSMLTGVGPETHQVLWNDYEIGKGVIRTPSIFSLAKAAGKTTAFFAAKSKFKHFETPGSFDRFFCEDTNAAQIAKTAAAYIREKKPHLTFVHFPDADGAGHGSGWGSPEQIVALSRVDQALSEVIRAIETAGITANTVVIVSADHGGHDRTHGSNSEADTVIPWMAWGKQVKPGTTIQAPVSTIDTAATSLWLLGVQIPPSMRGKPVVSAFN
jgi:predicted AlkP superfamily pyrophosphatase or phosphodiesterase